MDIYNISNNIIILCNFILEHTNNNIKYTDSIWKFQLKETIEKRRRSIENIKYTISKEEVKWCKNKIFSHLDNSLRTKF